MPQTPDAIKKPKLFHSHFLARRLPYSSPIPIFRKECSIRTSRHAGKPRSPIFEPVSGIKLLRMGDPGPSCRPLGDRSQSRRENGSRNLTLNALLVHQKSCAEKVVPILFLSSTRKPARLERPLKSGASRAGSTRTEGRKGHPDVESDA